MTQMKIMFIGESESGKTQVINQICNQRFDEMYFPTKDVDIKIWQKGNNRIAIWDTPGHERDRVFTNSYYRNTNTGVFIVNLTKKMDKAKIQYLQSAIQAFKEGCLPEARLILVGTKSDLVKEQNSADKLAEIQKLIEENQGFKFDICLPTSAKTELGIKKLQAALMNAPAIELVDDVKPPNTDARDEFSDENALYLLR
jgi:small GTP-binding protein